MKKEYIQFVTGLARSYGHDIMAGKQMKSHNGSLFRGVICYHLYHYFKLENSQIAKIFGLTARAVYYWVHRVEDLLEIDDEQTKKLYIKLKP